MFDSLNDQGQILYAATVGGVNLKALVTFTLDSLSSSAATFTVKVENQTLNQAGQNRIVSFGVETVAPTLDTAAADNGWGASLDVTFPGFQQVDLCIWDGANCSGGQQQGVGEGLSETLHLTLTTLGDFTTSGITFGEPFMSKWQSVGAAGRSYEFSGCVPGTSGVCDGVTPPQELPEPTTLALAGLSALLLVAGRRRRKS